MNKLILAAVIAAISAAVVTIACKTLGLGDASMVIGGGIGGAIGALTGSKTSDGEGSDT